MNTTGEFCHDLRDSLKSSNTGNLVFKECPNFYWHDGKELVLSLTWNNRPYILKGRSIQEKEMLVSDHERFLTDQSKYLIAFERLLSSTFTQKYKVDTHKLIPWSQSKSDREILNSNLTALRTVWLLSQDNEYVLSRSLSRKLIFPEVKSTCKHYYLVESAERVLDLAYIVPSVHLITKLFARGALEKLHVAIKLIEFLLRLETEKTGLELCDVKFDHFGFYEGGKVLLMIDSDMIFTKQVAAESISAMGNCTENRDCDFIDCQGACANGSCQYDPLDNNIRRICRNMFFMSIIDLSPVITLNLGLMGDFESLGFQRQLSQLQEICDHHFQDHQDPAEYAQKILDILQSINRSLSHT